MLRAPSLPLSEIAFELAAAKFGVQLADVGAALGSPSAIKDALKAAGFKTIKARTWWRSAFETCTRPLRQDGVFI